MSRTVFIGFLILVQWSSAESQLVSSQARASRSVSAFASVGYMEFVSGGILIQVADQYSLGLVASGFVVSERGFIFPDAALGVGVRGAYYFSRDGKNKFLWANAVLADVQYLVPRRKGGMVSTANPGGVGIEVMVGRDGIVGSGIGILWGVGIAGSFYSETPPLIMPAIRLGFHLDV
jgi:hypothetical protein